MIFSFIVEVIFAIFSSATADVKPAGRQQKRQGSNDSQVSKALEDLKTDAGKQPGKSQTGVQKRLGANNNLASKNQEDRKPDAEKEPPKPRKEPSTTGMLTAITSMFLSQPKGHNV